MSDSKKTIVIVLAAVAVILAGWSAWAVFAGSHPAANERLNTASGPISSRSSMFGPDENGKPRTERPPDNPGTQSQGPGGSPMNRMMGGPPRNRMGGPSGQQPPSQ